MCGIAGFIGRFDQALLNRMSQNISHRGPDGEGTLILNQSTHLVGFAHRRLAIIDLTAEGSQPMTVNCPCCGISTRTRAEEALWLIYNGELYNYQELRAELMSKGHRFHSKTDSEVLLHLYAEYDTGMLQKLNGMFAFALYDGKTREILLGRDGLGIKPLYYSQTPKGFLFSSELKSILQCGEVQKTLDPEALNHYLSYLWCPAPLTPLISVKKFEPGQAMLIENGHIKKQWFFYDVPYGKAYLAKTEDDIAKELAEHLERAVQKQLMSDVPVGAFLSGGLDSSAIVAMMRKLQPEQTIRCYSIGFTGNIDADGNVADLPYAQKVAQHLNVDLKTLMIDPKEILQLPRMIYHLDEPQADPAPINALLIAEQARRDGVKVLLSGAGGDDIFTGYRRHVGLQMEKYWAWLSPAMRRLLSNVFSGLAQRSFGQHSFVRRLDKLFMHASLPQAQRLASYFLWGPEKFRRQLYSQEMLKSLSQIDTLSPLLNSLGRLSDKTDPMHQMLYLETKHFLADHNLNYTDKVSMAAGIEVRVPLLDQDLVSFAAQIPPGLKQRKGVGKSIFKKAMEPYLPHEIIYRPKTGFGAPLRHWLKNELKPMVSEILSPANIAQRGIFDPATVTRLIKLNDEGKIDGAYTIFSVLSIELWCQMFIDGVNVSALSL